MAKESLRVVLMKLVCPAWRILGHCAHITYSSEKWYAEVIGNDPRRKGSWYFYPKSSLEVHVGCFSLFNLKVPPHERLAEDPRVACTCFKGGLHKDGIRASVI